jgi:NADPH-dependent 2,4-dienoyl-CoA reductase/sulfur reductase-like enzyme
VLNSPKVEGDAKKVVTTPQLHKQVKPWLKLFGTRFLGWATHIYLPMGKKVVVIGAGLHGLEVAEFLAKRGRKVTIVEPTEVIGEGVMDFRLGLTMDWLPTRGIEVVTEAKNIKVRNPLQTDHRKRSMPIRQNAACRSLKTLMPIRKNASMPISFRPTSVFGDRHGRFRYRLT